MHDGFAQGEPSAHSHSKRNAQLSDALQVNILNNPQRAPSTLCDLRPVHGMRNHKEQNQRVEKQSQNRKNWLVNRTFSCCEEGSLHARTFGRYGPLRRLRLHQDSIAQSYQSIDKTNVQLRRSGRSGSIGKCALDGGRNGYPIPHTVRSRGAPEARVRT